MMPTPTIEYDNWQNFLTGASLQAFEAVILKSPLLTNLLNAFGGAITLSGGGTYFDPQSNTIYIGPDYASASTPDGLAQLAVALAHELGHAEVSGGVATGLASASSVAAAIQQGLDSEGVAAATEFVVASQLAQAGLSTVLEMTGFSPQVVTAMTAALSNSGGAQAFTEATSLNGTGYLASASATGAVFFGNLQASPAPFLTYDQYYGDQWVLSSLFGVRPTDVNLQTMLPSSLEITPAGFIGRDIILQPGTVVTTGLNRYTTAGLEALSFTGAVTAGQRGVITLASLSSNSETVVGGLADHDVLVGGSKSYAHFEVDWAATQSGYTTTIVANASGMGDVFLYPGYTLGAAAPLTEIGTDQWTDGTYTYQFLSWKDIPSGDLQGINANTYSSVTVGDSVGELKVTSGLDGPTLDILGFDLQQAETGLGFLGISMPASLLLNFGSNAGVDPPAPDFIAGSEQSYTVSVGAPSDSPQTVTLTLGNVPASDFGIDTGDGVVALSSGGAFTVTIAAGQTSATFSLINTGDVGGSASMTLSATLPDPTDPQAGTISSRPLSQNYVEPTTDDPFAQPATPSLYLSGQFSTPQGQLFNLYTNHSGSQTPVSGVSSGNNYISVTGGANQSIAGGSGNDTIWASFGQVTTGGGLVDGGVDVITGNGGNDMIIAGSPSQTITSPEAHSDVRIYAGSQVDLPTAISNANTGTATGQQGDLIVSDLTNSTIVGGNGNDLILDGGNDLVVAGPGNETIVSGVFGVDDSLTSYDGGATSIPTAGQTWSDGLSGANQVVFSNNLYDYGVWNGSPTSGYEGNYDDFGAPFLATNSTIFGGSGNDLIELSNGNNEVELGTGDSTVFGGMGNNTIIGGGGADSLVGGGGSDYIDLGDGGGVAVGQGGDNTIFGGAGHDTIYAGGSYSNWAAAETGNNYVEAGSGDALINGSGGNDTLIGGSGNNTIQGGAGNEYIVGGTGNESINGGSGNETLVAGGAGADTIWAGAGNATIYGGDGADEIHGGSGTNVIYAGDGGTGNAPTTVSAGSGETTIYGGDGVDYLNGGTGDNVIYAGDGGTADAPTRVWAGSGDTTVYGGMGVDVIAGGSGTDVLYAGDGGTTDSPTEVVAGSGTATLYGGAGTSVLEDTLGGSDVLEAGDGDSTLNGIGNDTLIAGAGVDLLSGTGTNTYVIDSSDGETQIADAGGSETIDFTGGVDPADMTLSGGFYTDGNPVLVMEDDGASVSIDGGLGGANVAAVEFDGSSSTSLDALVQQVDAAGNAFDTVIAGANGNLVFDTASGDSITGGTGNDTISAWGNNDTIAASSGGGSIYEWGASSLAYGGTGTDSLSALGASDTLVGGTGTETFTVSQGSDVVQALAGAVSNSLFSSVSYTLPTHVDSLTLLGSGNLTATGNSDVNNVITGNAGNDVLNAGSGGDALISGTGVDTLVGDTGTDTFVINNIEDVIELPHGGLGDMVESSVNYTLTQAIGILELIGSSDLVATDSYGRAQVTGNAGHDTLIGGALADTLIAGSGVDTLVTGTGNNTLVINNAADVIEVSAGAAGRDTVQSSVSYALAAGLDTLTLTGGANIAGQGNSDAKNLITGNSGNDTLVAGSGSDTLVAGSGMDTLVAGTGTDLLEGSSAGDTYLLNQGFGATQIVLSAGSGTIEFGAGIAASDLSVSTVVNAAGNLALQITDGTSVVTVDDGRSGGLTEFDLSQLNFEFAGGAAMDFGQFMAAAHVSDSTLAGASGNLVLDGDAAVSLSGGFGDDTIIGTGAGDTIVAGSGGSQTLYGLGTGDLLAAGMGGDTLYGGGNDTLAAGTGDTIAYGGPGTNTYILTQGGSSTLYTAAGATGLQTIYLPDGMTLGDFNPIVEPNGDLFLQSVSGETTAIIKGLYSGSNSGVWLLADQSGNSQLLKDWVSTTASSGSGGGGGGGGTGGVGLTAYQLEVLALLREDSAELNARLQAVGARGGTLNFPDSLANGDDYHFTGVSTQDVTVQGSLFVPSSESKQTQTTVTQQGTRTETYTVPTYSTFSIPGSVTFIPVDDADVTNLLAGGYSITPITVDGHTGYAYYNQPQTGSQQTGTHTVSVTVPVISSYTTETQGFTDYNITGDGGDDGINADPEFVGTVVTGDGNVNVNLGAANTPFWLDNFPGDLGHYDTRYPLPLGAFIDAGNGADNIVGSGGVDTITAGYGSDTIMASLGSTIYVPMDRGSTDYIEVLNPPFYGNGPYPQSTLVLPQGVTPGDLAYQVLPGTGPAAIFAYPFGLDAPIDQETLEIAYGGSAVFLTFGVDPPSSYLHGADSNNTTGINRFEFADGTVLTRSQMLAIAESGGGARLEFYQATAADQSVVGAAAGPDTLMGGYNGDTLVGASGDDTFEYHVGWGAETIVETGSSGGENNTLQLGAGISVAAITGIRADGSSLTLDIDAYGESTDSIVLAGCNPGDLLGSVPIQKFQFADGTTMSWVQLLNQIPAYGNTVNTPDGGTLSYSFGKSGNTLYTAQAADAAGLVTMQYFLYTDGSTDVRNYTLYADGNLSSLIEVVTPADGIGATTTAAEYNTDNQYTSYDITNPDGSTDNTSYTYNSDGSNGYIEVVTPADGSGATTTADEFNSDNKPITEDVTNPDGSTDNYTYTYNPDGSGSYIEVLTPADGSGATTTVMEFNTTGYQDTSIDVTNPDGSTVDGTAVYNPDGSYVYTAVSTPAPSAADQSVTTEVSAFDSAGNQLSENTYTPAANGSYTDSWQAQDGSTGNYWWNASTREYQETWHDSNGASWTDDYQYAAGGAPGGTGVSFTETYTDSAGDQGTRQFNAVTGVTTLSWDSTATGTITGTTTDAGFIGLQNDGELTNTQPDPSFFNPAVSPAFQSYLAGH